LPLIKFFDLVGFREIFDFAYKALAREPKLGHYSMMTGLLMLLFIGFNRIWHFSYLRLDAMLCGFFNLTRLPVAIGRRCWYGPFEPFLFVFIVNLSKSTIN